MDRDSRNTDEGLQGNEKIEQAVYALQQERDVHISFGYGNVIHNRGSYRRDKRCDYQSLEPHIDAGQEFDTDRVGKSDFLTVFYIGQRR